MDLVGGRWSWGRGLSQPTHCDFNVRCLSVGERDDAGAARHDFSIGEEKGKQSLLDKLPAVAKHLTFCEEQEQMGPGTQADHDRAFNESLSEPPDDDTIRADCGHWESESRCDIVDGRVICPRCVDDPFALKRIKAQVQLPKRLNDSEVA